MGRGWYPGVLFSAEILQHGTCFAAFEDTLKIGSGYSTNKHCPAFPLKSTHYRCDGVALAELWGIWNGSNFIGNERKDCTHEMIQTGFKIRQTYAKKVLIWKHPFFITLLHFFWTFHSLISIKKNSLNKIFQFNFHIYAALLYFGFPQKHSEKSWL